MAPAIRVHDPVARREDGRFRVYVEFINGMVGLVVADGPILVHVYVSDDAPVILAGEVMAPGRDLFDVDPVRMNRDQFDALLADPETGRAPYVKPGR